MNISAVSGSSGIGLSQASAGTASGAVGHAGQHRQGAHRAGETGNASGAGSAQLRAPVGAVPTAASPAGSGQTTAAQSALAPRDSDGDHDRGAGQSKQAAAKPTGGLNVVA